MVIKEKFILMKNVDNLLNLSKNVLASYEKEENSPRNLFTFLKQREKQIKNHFSKNKIFKLVTEKESRENLHIVNFDKYILPVSYSPPAKGIIVNLKPFDVDEIVDLSPSNVYALLVYAFSFSQLVTKKVNVPESYAKPIIDFLLSMFVKVFGKEYGLLGIYASGIPKLKYLIACYILSAFFGNATSTTLLRKATKLAPYDYSNEKEQLLKYDFSRIDQFVRALSELKVMGGVKAYGFTTQLYKYFGATFLPALEDLSRFISVMTTSNIKGSTVVRSFLYTYNETAFDRILEIPRRVFR